MIFGTIWEYKCKTCANKAVEEQMISSSYSACGHCYKKLVDEETWNKHKTNWRKRFALGHGEKVINHDCQPKCKLCRKEFKLTQEYVDIYGVWYEYCPLCSIKEIKQDIAKPRSQWGRQKEIKGIGEIGW